MQTNKPSFINVMFFDAHYQRARFYSAFILYFLILIIGSIPNARAEVGIVAPGYVLHTIAYSAITLLLATGSKSHPVHALLQAFVVVLIMGAADEYLQSYFPYRHSSFSDWFVDGAASLLTILLVRRRVISAHTNQNRFS